MFKKILLLFFWLVLILGAGTYVSSQTNQTLAWDLPIPGLPTAVPTALPTVAPNVPTGENNQLPGGTDPYKEAANKPASLADEPLTIELYQLTDNSSGEEKFVGWSPVINGRILGKTKAGDAVLVEVSSGGKALQTYRIGMKGTNVAEGEWCEDWNIGQDDNKLLTATGDLTFTFKFYNDDTAKESILSKRIVKVVKAVQHIGSGKHAWKYGIIYDDLLGSAYINQWQQSDISTREIWMFFWIRNDNIYDCFKNITYRIEVNGKKIDLPNDFGDNTSDKNRLEQKEELWIKNDRVDNKYNFYKVQCIPKMYWGPIVDNLDKRGWIGLINYPGEWKMAIRDQGKVMREFKFKVENGMIVPHPEQDSSKPGFLNLGPNRAYLEVYFPNPDEFDSAFNPDAIRKGVLYGRPWVSDQIKNGMLKALPPAKTGKMPFPTPKFPK